MVDTSQPTASTTARAPACRVRASRVLGEVAAVEGHERAGHGRRPLSGRPGSTGPWPPPSGAGGRWATRARGCCAERGRPPTGLTGCLITALADHPPLVAAAIGRLPSGAGPMEPGPALAPLHARDAPRRHRHGLRGGMDLGNQPAPDPGQLRRCGPSNLIGPVPRAAQARVPQRPDGLTLYLLLRRFFVAAPTRYRPHCSVY